MKTLAEIFGKGTVGKIADHHLGKAAVHKNTSRYYSDKFEKTGNDDDDDIDARSNDHDSREHRLKAERAMGLKRAIAADKEKKEHMARAKDAKNRLKSGDYYEDVAENQEYDNNDEENDTANFVGLAVQDDMVGIQDFVDQSMKLRIADFFNGQSEEDSDVQEDVEQIDEISKEKLGRYINRASSDMTDRAVKNQAEKTKRDDLRNAMSSYSFGTDPREARAHVDAVKDKLYQTDKDVEKKHYKKMRKREDGIYRAVTKITGGGEYKAKVKAT